MLPRTPGDQTVATPGGRAPLAWRSSRLRAAVADPCFATGGGHGDQGTIEGQFPHGVWVGRAGLAELVRCEPQPGGESLRQISVSKSIPMCSIVQWLVLKSLQISSFT
jgi:hypothetical protein